MERKPLHPKLLETPYFNLYLERSEAVDSPLLHVMVHEWNPSSLRLMRNVWGVLVNNFTARGEQRLYGARLPDDEKLKKFGKMFKWEDTDMRVMDNDGRERILMVYNFGEKDEKETTEAKSES